MRWRIEYEDEFQYFDRRAEAIEAGSALDGLVRVDVDWHSEGKWRPAHQAEDEITRVQRLRTIEVPK